MSDETYQLLIDFQTLLVGAVGFLGVILTLIANARLSRKAEKDSLEQRRLSVVAAVTAELTLFRATFDRLSEHADEDTEWVVVPRMELRHFEAVTDEIGLLGPDLCKDVLNAILAIEEINSIFAIEALESTEYNFRVDPETLELAADRMQYNGEVIDRALAGLSISHSAKR